MARLFICGDIINLTGFQFIGDRLASKIAAADYCVCNLEGPEVEINQIAKCPHQEAGTVEYLREKGFDLFLLANNHITELEETGVSYTINTILKNGGNSIGAGLSYEQAYRPLVVNIGGVSFGFINICEAQVGHFSSSNQSFGYAWMGQDGVMETVRDLSVAVDRVIVYVHSGLEHYSIPIPELRQFYRNLCDEGADCIIGGHTHTAQGYEYYGQKLIVYSLGNFYFPHFDGKYNNENSSYSVILEIPIEGKIIVEPLFHILQGHHVELCSGPEAIDIDYLCSLLGEGYEDRVNTMAVEAYDRLCSHLLAQATLGEQPDMSSLARFKSLVKRLLTSRRKINKTSLTRDKLLLRLFENEPYRWTITRALKLKTNKQMMES